MSSKAESDMNRFMSLAAFVILFLILVPLVSIAILTLREKDKAKQEVSQTETSVNNRLKQIKQEVISIDIPLPLTEKEQRLTALKAELLTMVDTISKDRVTLSKEEARLVSITNGLDALKTLDSRSEKLKKRQSLIASRKNSVYGILISSEYADELAHSTYRYCDHGKCKHKGGERNWRSKCIHPAGCRLGRCLHKTAVVPNAFPCKRKNCKMHNKKREAKDKSIHDIDPKIAQYLEDDTFELKIGITLKKADSIWGKPDRAERSSNSDGSRKMNWDYGNYWSRDSKLPGIYYYKSIIFKDGKIDWWQKNADVKIKTPDLRSFPKDHLDEGPILSKGLSKTALYKLWGLPYKIKVTCFNDKSIKSRWLFQTNKKFSHSAEFVNNKLNYWSDTR